MKVFFFLISFLVLLLSLAFSLGIVRSFIPLPFSTVDTIQSLFSFPCIPLPSAAVEPHSPTQRALHGIHTLAAPHIGLTLIPT